MPTYDYECTKCGHTFEAFQRITDKPLSRCPECKSALRRMIGGGMAVIFKGSGFYTTDYKKGSALSGSNGGNGGNGGGKEKDKMPEKPKESSADKAPSGKAAAS